MPLEFEFYEGVARAEDLIESWDLNKIKLIKKG